MSQENVEKVRAAYDAWNRNDFDAAFAFADQNWSGSCRGPFQA
jgi:hypothetical protein